MTFVLPETLLIQSLSVVTVGLLANAETELGVVIPFAILSPLLL